VGLCAPLASAIACSSSSDNGSGSSDDSGTDAGSGLDGTTSSSSSGSSSGASGSSGSSSGSGSSGASGSSSGGHDSGAADGGDSGAADSGDAGPISQKVAQTNLFADTADGGAPHVDPNLVNPWGLAFNPSGIAWVSANGPGLATLYMPASPAPVPKTVTIPPPSGGGATGTPSGQVFNAGAASGDFMNDLFIFSTEDGTVVGWNNTADPFDEAGTAIGTIQYDNSAAGAVYKGLAINPTTPPTLLLADFHNGRIDMLDHTYAVVTGDGGSAWKDPSVPTGFAPFNIFVSGNKVYVSYAKPLAPDLHDDQKGPGNGAVSVFDTSGTLVKSLVATGGALNSPWGMAMAPTGWGQLGGMLLVGNFGDGHVNAYNPTSGSWVGSLVTSTGPLGIDGLWALVFGPNDPDAGVTTSQLYFTAGTNAEADGLFGYLTPQ
jgi:uncharacterized protein (TIGR03118 family)